MQTQLNQPTKNYSLSVIVITKNESDRVQNCLASVVDIADEIIVLDSGSTDNTVEIVKQFTDKVFVTDWPGFGVQKQRALEKASCEWVLSLDADEVLSDELRDEINILLSGNPKCIAYKMQLTEILLGKRLRFGPRTKYALRLFRRGKAAFSDWIVHERVILQNGDKAGVLKAKLRHCSIRDFEHLMDKYNLYASLAAQRRFDEGVHGGGLVGAVLRAMFVFVRIYILRLGFLDGGAGLLMAVMQSQYSFNKYAGLWYLRSTKNKK